MKKKGFTLIELVVAMGIFTVLSTIVVGAYVVVINLRGMTKSMNESQQKLRMTLEQISRLARQADQAKVTSSGRVLDLYFNGGTSSGSAYRYEVTGADPYGLGKRECASFTDPSTNRTCDSWTPTVTQPPVDMLGSLLTLNNNSVFSINSSVTPMTLLINLDGEVDFSNNYYDNKFNLESEIILEGLRWSK